MSKGLEALEKVEDFFIDYGSFDETGEYKNYISLYQTQEYQVIKKELKALEIIKNKYIDPHDFILCCYTMNNKKWIDYEEYKKAYLNYYENDEYMLTQEEYDLLKEVLL